MTDLTDLRDLLRIDLKDAGATDWANATLDRHIQRALLEYSQVDPLEVKTGLTATPNSRDLSLSTLTPRIRVVAAEWQTGEYPPSYVPFTLWADTLTLDVSSAPTAADTVNIFWHKVHSINGAKTYPAAHDDMIVGGAAGYATLEFAAFTPNKINVGGDQTWGRYMEFSSVRLATFREQLRALPAANRLRSGRFYTPQEVRFRSQTTDPGPV